MIEAFRDYWRYLAVFAILYIFANLLLDNFFEILLIFGLAFGLFVSFGLDEKLNNLISKKGDENGKED